MLRDLLSIIKLARRPFPVLLVFFSIVGSFLDAVSIALIVPLLSAIVDPLYLSNNSVFAAIFGALGITGNFNRIIAFCGALVVFFVLKLVYQLFVLYYQSQYYSEGVQNLSTDLLEKYLRSDFLFHLNNNPADLIRNVKTEIPIIFFRILFGSINIITDVVLLTGILGVLLYYEPVVTLAGLVVLGLVNVIFFRSIRANVKKNGLIRQEHEAETYKWISQSLGGIKELKVLDRVQFFMDKSRSSFFQLKKTAIYSEIMGKSPKIFIEGLAFVLLVGLILVLLLTAGDGQTALPKVAMFAAALFRVMPSVNRLLGETIQIRFSRPALDVVVKAYRDVSENTTETESGSGTSEGDRTLEPALALEELKISNLCYRYPATNQAVLSDFSLTIEKNQSVGIIGSSGSGKTTFLNVLLGLLHPQSGSIFVGRTDVLANLRLWKRMIGFVPQDIFLLDDTIRANVAYGVPTEQIDDKEVWRALELAQLDGFIRDSSGGLDARVGDRGVRLSGGQRQRIGIARALYRNPEVLIFDEATSALDTETEAEITKAIDSLMGKKTIIIVAHRLSTLRNCHRIYRVENGRAVLVESAEGISTQ